MQAVVPMLLLFVFREGLSTHCKTVLVVLGLDTGVCWRSGRS